MLGVSISSDTAQLSNLSFQIFRAIIGQQTPFVQYKPSATLIPSSSALRTYPQSKLPSTSSMEPQQAAAGFRSVKCPVRSLISKATVFRRRSSMAGIVNTWPTSCLRSLLSTAHMRSIFSSATTIKIRRLGQQVQTSLALTLSSPDCSASTPQAVLNLKFGDEIWERYQSPVACL